MALCQFFCISAKCYFDWAPAWVFRCAHTMNLQPLLYNHPKFDILYYTVNPIELCPRFPHHRNHWALLVKKVKYCTWVLVTCLTKYRRSQIATELTIFSFVPSRTTLSLFCVLWWEQWRTSTRSESSAPIRLA